MPYNIHEYIVDIMFTDRMSQMSHYLMTAFQIVNAVILLVTVYNLTNGWYHSKDGLGINSYIEDYSGIKINVYNSGFDKFKHLCVYYGIWVLARKTLVWYHGDDLGRNNRRNNRIR